MESIHPIDRQGRTCRVVLEVELADRVLTIDRETAALLEEAIARSFDAAGWRLAELSRPVLKGIDV